MKDLTQDQLKELLHYNPDTGIFTNLTSRGGVKVGGVAGCLNNRGYIDLQIQKKTCLTHRLAFLYMTGEWPADQVDHINGVKDDNRWGNLRDVTNQENGRNQKRRNDNTSGVTGVCWYKQTGKWVAQIKIKNKKKFLGYFADFNEAVSARKEAELEHGFHTNHGRG